MKKYSLRFLSFILIIIMVLSLIPLNVFAATTNYETIKDDVPVWKEASSKSLKQYTIAEKGTVITVIASKVNSAGNLWYQLTDGNWIFSGNVKKHSHKGAMCGKDSYSYEQKNSSSHTVIIKTPDLCSCGYLMGYQTATKTEKHSFNSSNECSKCGYKAVHKHQEVMCGQDSYSYEPKNSSSHTVIIKTPDLCSCGYVMGYQTSTKTEEHTFDANSKCTKCGYKEEHVHEAVMCGKASYSYEQKDSTTHTVVTTLPDLCSCGYVMGHQTSTKTEEHSFDANSKCTKCGHDRVHIHMVSNTIEDNQYFVVNDQLHIFITEFAKICDCGQIVSTQENKTVDNHKYNENGFCSCGYRKETDSHIHKRTKRGDSSISYATGNLSVHVEIVKTSWLCECGSIADYEMLTIESPHHFQGGFCQECGIEQGMGILDISASQMIEQAVEGNFSDTFTLAGLVAEIIIGEIPYVGTVADARDVIYDIVNEEDFLTILIDASAFIPLAGSIFKYSDEITAINKLSRAGDYGIDSYKVLKKQTKGTGLEVHHIIEKRFAEVLGWNSDDMLSVVLTHDEHNIFTQKWRSKIPWGIDYSQLDEDYIWMIAQDIYKDYPELLSAANKTIFK